MKTRHIKAINAEFIQTRALSKLSFVQFRPYATSFPVLFLSDVNVKKQKDPGDEFGPYASVQDLHCGYV